MRRRPLLLGVLGALLFFTLGIVAASFVGSKASPRAREHETRAPAVDAGEPIILFDPDSIRLLPDASLELRLPAAFADGGT